MKSFVSLMSTKNFFFLRLDHFIQLLNTSSVIIGLEFVFSNLCLTVSENLLSLSFHESPNLFIIRVLSLNVVTLRVTCVTANNGSLRSIMTDGRRQTRRQAFFLRVIGTSSARIREPCRWWRHRSRSHWWTAARPRIPGCLRHKPPWCGSRWAHNLWEARTRPGCQGPQRKCTGNLPTTSWKKKLTGRRKDRVIREKMMKKKWVELSKRGQSDTTTTMRMKHGCDGMSADPNLSHACACDSRMKNGRVKCGVHKLNTDDVWWGVFVDRATTDANQRNQLPQTCSRAKKIRPTTTNGKTSKKRVRTRESKAYNFQYCWSPSEDYFW